MADLSLFSPRALCGELKPMPLTNAIRMNTLKFICLAVAQFAKQIWLLPRSIAAAVEQKRQGIVRNKLEAERLDRIRHPEKYQGR